MKRSFLNHDKPWLTGFIITDNAEDALRMIEKTIRDGGDSVAIEITRLRPEYHTREVLTELFAAAGDLPVYSCCYRSGYGEGMTDEEIASLSLLCLDCGATLIDVMGDLYDPTPWEMTEDPAAIKKQMALIAEIHARGGEVLMSAHNHKYYPPEQILAWMQEQAARGADVAKDIGVSDTEAELCDALETFRLLNEQLPVPYLFMTGGEWRHATRLFGGALGSFMYLGRVFEEGVQPELTTLKRFRDAENDLRVN